MGHKFGDCGHTEQNKAVHAQLHTTRQQRGFVHDTDQTSESCDQPFRHISEPRCSEIWLQQRNQSPFCHAWLLLGCADVQAVDDEEVFLNIDLMHMYEYDRELYGQLIAYPGEVIPLLDNEARYIAADLLGEELPEDKMLTVSEDLSAKQGMLLLIKQAAGVPY